MTTSLQLKLLSPEEVSSILKFCSDENIKVVPRGAGTGLSGGALPLQDAIADEGSASPKTYSGPHKSTKSKKLSRSHYP